jgi:hypothetical protein
MSLTNITVLNEVPQVLFHVWPIKHRLYTLQTFVVSFMSVVVEFSKDSLSQQRSWFEANAVLEIQQPRLITPRSHDLILQNFVNQLLQVRILLHLGLDRLHPSRHELGDGRETPCRDSASATEFSLPFLYSIIKSLPTSLMSHFCCASVTIVWSHKYLRLRWSVPTTKLWPNK